jgi:glyoxylase-like metal-dependent hydrolase (beta-lactamase superfamily II)
MRTSTRVRLFVVATALVAACGLVLARQAPAPDPLVREGAAVKLGTHTWAIPDNNVPLVPNVGIVVGSRATLVIDPGLGRRNGEAVLRDVARVTRNTELYIVSTHFHAEHTTGYLAFPASATYINSRVQEEEFEQGGLQMVANR